MTVAPMDIPTFNEFSSTSGAGGGFVPPTASKVTMLRPVVFPSKDQFDMMLTYARLAVESGCYTGVNSIPRAMQVILKGFHLGIDPMEALIQIVFTGNKMTMQAQLMIALANRSQLCKMLDIPDPSDVAKSGIATVRIVRVDREGEYIGTFSKDDAIKAGLWDKSFPWKQYPGAMLVNRAVSLTLRRAVPEVLGGIYLPDEIEPDDDRTSTGKQKPILTIDQQALPKTQIPELPQPAAHGRDDDAMPMAPEDVPHWWQTSDLASLVERAVKAGYIEQGQGAKGLLDILGAKDWQAYQSVAEAGKAIKAAVEKMKPAQTAPAQTDGEAHPDMGKEFEILVNGGTYDGQRIIFDAPLSKHGMISIQSMGDSRQEFAKLTGQMFAEAHGIEEWALDENGKPTSKRWTDSPVMITYKVTKSGAAKVIKAVPEIPF